MPLLQFPFHLQMSHLSFRSTSTPWEFPGGPVAKTLRS